MKKVKTMSFLLLAPLFCLLFLITNVSALNITIYDNKSSATTGWYGQNENNEVEPGCAQDQVWDLESFDLTGTILKVTSGYNNVLGQGGIRAGDIFIDLNGDAKYGDGVTGTPSATVKNTFGYDFVFDLDFSSQNPKYDVYSLDSNSNVLTAIENINQTSNPWRYLDGGIFRNFGSITNIGSFTDSEGTHYTFSVDLADINTPSPTNFLAHYTMECGNDNLMGQGKTVPEPGTLLFLGAGLLGLGFAIRRRKS